MAEASLYLFKTARRPRYRKENLDLLAAERGTVVEVSYNRSWVAPEFFDEGAIGRGARACFVFTDRPYDRFVPVRDGEVVRTRSDDLSLRIQVLLRNPVGVADADVPAFTSAVKEAAGENAPPHKFVAPRADGVELASFFDDREVEGWRRSVDAVLEMSAGSADRPYRRSVFFRPTGIRREDGEVVVARRTSLEEGESVRLLLAFHNPHLEPGEVEGLELRARAPEETLRVEGPGPFPRSGAHELGIEAVGEGERELRLEIRPAPARHTGVLERFARPGRERRTEAGAGPAGRVPEETVRELFEVVDRTMEARGPEEMAEVLRAFEGALPGAQELPERRALLLAGAGRGEEAFRILSALNPELLGDDARFLLFRERIHRDPELEAADLVAEYDLAHERRFGRLVDELEGLDDRTLDRLVPELVERLPEASQAAEVLDRVGARLTSPEAASRTALALFMAHDDAEGAFAFLKEQRRRLASNHPELLETLLELARAGGGNRFDEELCQGIEVHVTNLIHRDESGEAERILRRASPSIGGARRRALYHEVADRYERRDEAEAALRLMVEFAWASCRNGRLEDASEAVERALGLWAGLGGGEVPPKEVREARDAVTAAWEENRELAAWRKSFEERRRERLRERYLNERLLVAGGVRRPEWMAEVEELTGAEVEWCERYRGDGDDLRAYAERIRAGRYAAVVHLFQKTGHATGDVLKPACEEAGVPWLHATSAGKRGVVEGLEGEN